MNLDSHYHSPSSLSLSAIAHRLPSPLKSSSLHELQVQLLAGERERGERGERGGRTFRACVVISTVSMKVLKRFWASSKTGREETRCFSSSSMAWERGADDWREGQRSAQGEEIEEAWREGIREHVEEAKERKFARKNEEKGEKEG